MAIIAPTIDEFDEPTVMLIIRNLVKWIQTDLVPQINANDIVSATHTSDGLSFEINLIKGDGTQIHVGKITLEDEDNIASGSFHFDDETRMLSGTLLKEDGTSINIPAVEIPVGSGTQIDYGIQTIQFTYQDNNLSCVITQKDGTQTTSNTVVIAGGGGTGGNPYPTSISGTVSGTNLNFTMNMSEGSPVTAVIDLSAFATVAMLADYATNDDLEEIQTQITAIQINTTVSQDSSNVIKISNAVNGNSADMKIDLAVVGTDIVLTAENSDATQQATTKISVSDMPVKIDYNSYLVSNDYGNIAIDADSISPYSISRKYINDTVQSVNNIFSGSDGRVYLGKYTVESPTNVNYAVNPNIEYTIVGSYKVYPVLNEKSIPNCWIKVHNAVFVASPTNSECEDDDYVDVIIKVVNNTFNTIKTNKKWYTSKERVYLDFTINSYVEVYEIDPGF